jgi:hypothetical protein
MKCDGLRPPPIKNTPKKKKNIIPSKINKNNLKPPYPHFPIQLLKMLFSTEKTRKKK